MRGPQNYQTLVQEPLRSQGVYAALTDTDLMVQSVESGQTWHTASPDFVMVPWRTNRGFPIEARLTSSTKGDIRIGGHNFPIRRAMRPGGDIDGN